MSQITESEARRQLTLAQYGVARLHNIMHELPEGWHIVTDDGEWTYRATQRRQNPTPRGAQRGHAGCSGAHHCQIPARSDRGHGRV